jgi:predicted Zn-dependent peptidase
MKKTLIKNVDEYLYFDELDNGLKIYMIPNKNVNRQYASFTTKFGSVNTKFIPINQKEMKTFPYGIAHFLEHKLFEKKDKLDPMMFFGKTGTTNNAVTTHFFTSYMFEGDSNFYNNLKFLLDFVQKPLFTEESTEKEKGIIEQEISMYDDIPVRNLFEKMFYNMFKVNPIKHPIGGAKEDIQAITKEMLYECYNTAYNPQNMFLVITGNFNVEKTLQTIKENQSSKQFNDIKEIITAIYEEPKEVDIEYAEKDMKLEIPYVGFGIKAFTGPININEEKKQLYLDIILKHLFSKTSDFYERMIKEGILDSSIDMDHLLISNYTAIILITKTKRYEELINEIKENLKNISITEEFLERKKKVYISSLIYSFENIEELNDDVIDDIILFGDYNTNMYDTIKSLNIDELNKFLSELDFNNTSTVIIK